MDTARRSMTLYEPKKWILHDPALFCQKLSNPTLVEESWPELGLWIFQHITPCHYKTRKLGISCQTASKEKQAVQQVYNMNLIIMKSCVYILYIYIYHICTLISTYSISKHTHAVSPLEFPKVSRIIPWFLLYLNSISGLQPIRASFARMCHHVIFTAPWI